MRAVSFVAAGVLLNASLSFHNIWPTPAIAWWGELSVECALLLVALAVVRSAYGATRAAPMRSPLVIRTLSIVWVVLVLGHYADVTTPALYGREINLYFDLQFMPDVAAMVVRAAPLWLTVVAVIAILLVFVLFYVIFRWALSTLVDGMDASRPRALAAVAGCAVVIVFVVQHAIGRGAEYQIVPFAAPVTATYARQARLVADARAGTNTLPPSPALDADLARVAGADVLLIFIEAYGAVAYERPDIASQLIAARAAFDAALRASGHDAVSAFVESPT
jgi:hypothetical protein